jgi:hypothetical protein
MPERHETGESDVSALCYGSLKTQWVNILSERGSTNRPEMEFLNINLTKDVSLLLNAIHQCCGSGNGNDHLAISVFLYIL